MQCPTDGTVLVMSERSGIEIDYCPTCRGVWLDRGELDKILERSLTQPGPAAARPAATQQAARPAPGGPTTGATQSDQRYAAAATAARRRRAGSASCSTEPDLRRPRRPRPCAPPRRAHGPAARAAAADGVLVAAAEEDRQVGMGRAQRGDGVAHGGDVVGGRHAEDDGVGTLAVQRDHPALGRQVAADVHDVEPGPPQHRGEGEHAQLVPRAPGEADDDPRCARRASAARRGRRRAAGARRR